MTASLARSRDAIALSDVVDVDGLVDELVELDRRGDGSEAGFVWSFGPRGEFDDIGLTVGVRGEIGAITWYDDEHAYVPESGLNTAHVDYFTWHGHHFPQDPGAEVPVEVAFTALREYIATGERPTCVNWRQLPDV